MARGKKSRIRLAWGDESVRMHDNPSRYMIGVTLCDLDEAEVRAGFEACQLCRNGKKAHWHEMTELERRRSVELVNGLGLRHVVISAEPLLDTMRPERARRKCLETLLPILENQYGVTQLFMESRSRKQDREEMQFIQATRLRRFIDRLEYDLQPGISDARLWIPDQVLGTVGTSEWQGAAINGCETHIISID